MTFTAALAHRPTRLRARSVISSGSLAFAAGGSRLRHVGPLDRVVVMRKIDKICVRTIDGLATYTMSEPEFAKFDSWAEAHGYEDTELTVNGSTAAMDIVVQARDAESGERAVLHLFTRLSNAYWQEIVAEGHPDFDRWEGNVHLLEYPY